MCCNSKDASTANESDCRYEQAATDFENARRISPESQYLVVNYTTLSDIDTIVLCAAGEEPEFPDFYEQSEESTFGSFDNHATRNNLGDEQTDTRPDSEQL